MDLLAALGRTWNDAFTLSQAPNPDSDDVLDLEPTADGFGYAVSVGRFSTSACRPTTFLALIDLPLLPRECGYVRPTLARVDQPAEVPSLGFGGGAGRHGGVVARDADGVQVARHRLNWSDEEVLRLVMSNLPVGTYSLSGATVGDTGSSPTV